MSIETELLQRLQFIDARLRSLERIELPVAGSGGFAPSDAQYLTLSANASLTNERIFTPVAPLSGADGGAGAAYSLSITAAALTRVNDTNITLTLGGSPASALLAATSLTLGWTGLLGLSRGGTAADLSVTGGSGQYLKQSSLGAVVTVGTIPASDIASGAALTKSDDTNITLTLGGSPTTALLAATSLTLGWTGTLSTARGGTGAGSLAAAGIVTGTGASGQMTYWTGTNTVGSAAQVAYAASGNLFTITSGAATDVPLKLVGAAAQSGDYIGVYDSAGNLVGNLSSVGSLSLYGTGGSLALLRLANAATVFQSRVNGSVGAESYPVSGNVISSFTARSYNGGTFPSYTLQSVGAIGYIASENHSATQFGTYWRVTTTPNGATAVAVTLVASANGNVGVGTLTEAGTSATKTIFQQTGTEPAGDLTNAYQQFSKDRGGSAGQAWPHVRTEDGTNGSLGITVSEVNLTGQTAAIAATTLYAVPAGAGGVYTIYWVATVTTAATTSSVLGGAAGFQTSYTDGNDSVVKTAPGTVTPGVNSNATNSTATGTITGCYTVFAKASTNISYLIGYTSVGATAMAYNLHIVCRRLT